MDLREVDGTEASASVHSPRQRHPWEVTRFEFFQTLLRRTGTLQAGTKILDVGSGDAWFAGQLAAHNSLPQITCWDLNYHPESASDLGVEADHITLCNQRPGGKFDLILMMDVLEHVENDVEFLCETVEKNLQPGGTLLISVPAWKQLTSKHDLWLQHFRRYIPGEFDHALRAAGLAPAKKGGLFHTLLLPRGLGVLRERLRSSTPQAEQHNLQWSGGPLTTKLVQSALRADTWISQRAADLGLPLPGLSLWALCKHQS